MNKTKASTNLSGRIAFLRVAAGFCRRVFFFAFVAVLGIRVASAQPDRAASAFWKSVQPICDATSAKPASPLGERVAQVAISEFSQFGGHQIDSTGRLFRFGRTEAEQGDDSNDSRQTRLGQLAWWQVLKYWRALYGNDVGESLEVRGYRDASSSAAETQSAGLLRSNAARLLRTAEETTDPALREILREAIIRAAITDTSWSAAFISYVLKSAEAPPNTFRYAGAHRVYIYDAFATSVAEVERQPAEGLYRACPVTTTKPRVGDLICQQREPSLAKASDVAVRETIRSELNRPEARTIQRTHCEVVAHIDPQARKVYTIGGNANQSVAARKLNLTRGLKLSSLQGGSCGGPGAWTLPRPASETNRGPNGRETCSLNDRKWFVLLQMR